MAQKTEDAEDVDPHSQTPIAHVLQRQDQNVVQNQNHVQKVSDHAPYQSYHKQVFLIQQLLHTVLFP